MDVPKQRLNATDRHMDGSTIISGL